jgi:hypothetical protein
MQKYKRSAVAWWGLTGLLATGAYYLHYHKPDNSPSTLYVLHHPLQAAEYFLIYIGRPLSDRLSLAASWGAILLLALVPIGYLIWQQRKHINKFLPWLAILLFVILAGALTTVSRAGFGLEQAVSSRYTAISLLYTVALIGITATLISLCKSNRIQKTAIVGLVALNIPLLLLCDIQGLQGFKDRSLQMRTIQSCTHELNPTKECLLVTIPGSGVSKSDLQYIKNKHWGGY